MCHYWHKANNNRTERNSQIVQNFKRLREKLYHREEGIEIDSPVDYKKWHHQADSVTIKHKEDDMFTKSQYTRTLAKAPMG